MGSSEAETSSKSPKKSTAQEQPAVTSSVPAPAPATPSYPDWSNFQAYSPVPPHGYFPSSSPQTHPYMWGAQPMMPPYVMYPPGGIYAHPSMPPGSHPFSPYAMPSPNGATDAPKEIEGKSSEGKEKSPIKRSKDSLGSLNMISAKLSGTNGALSQSGESGSDSSTEGSDANSQNDSQPEQFGDGSQNGKRPMGSGQVAAGPTTNLNIGMDYWTSPVPANNNNTGKAAANNSVVPSEHWIQNERELKKLKRKQSNRESARRSRLRKQAECEELAIRAEALKQENSALRAEVERIRKEYEELVSYNDSLKKKIGEAGPDKKDENNDNEKNPN
ncbi:hypothetical protein LUZ60_007324 [Juncus effusus]|nr:hypothetical protein LUZ60_007324 [Juncus effusus]